MISSDIISSAYGWTDLGNDRREGERHLSWEGIRDKNGMLFLISVNVFKGNCELKVLYLFQPIATHLLEQQFSTCR